MDAETLAALKASIAKWDKNAEAEKPGEYLTGSADCALCVLFIDDACIGCPVNMATGRANCIATPYYGALKAKYEWVDRADAKEYARDAASEEAEFLRSLLPPGETA